jgi:hypothetical protein
MFPKRRKTMASLLESLGQSLTPEMMGSIGGALGLDPKMVQQGVNVVGPLLQGGLANSASTSEGLDSLMNILTPPTGGSAPAAGSAVTSGDLGGLLDSVGGSDMVGSIMGMLGGQGGSSSGDMITPILTGLFGSGAMVAINQKLDKAVGFKISPLIPLVTPIILGLLKKKTNEEHLDSNGVANLLKQEQSNFLATDSPESRMVQDAMKAGQDAVALKGKFTADEWTKIRMVPIAASALVIGSAPSNAAGVATEVGAGMQAVVNNRGDADAASLLNVAFGEPLTDAEKAMVTQKVPKERLISALREGASLVASKDPNEKAAYRQFVLSVATAVASATKEGGFFGFGGKQINAAEQAAIDEIAAVMAG